MKKTVLLLSELMLVASLWAVPAKRVYRSVRLTDGSTVMATLCGDESYRFYRSVDGRPLYRNEDGTFSWTNSELTRKMWAKRAALRNAHRQERGAKMRALMERQRDVSRQQQHLAPARTETEVTESKKGLVILVNFKDNDKKMKHSREEWNAQFNEEGYSKNEHVGSVRDYFRDQSLGQLTIDFDVVGPYELSNTMKYYGRNAYYRVNPRTGELTFVSWNPPSDYETGNYTSEDANPFEMIYEACKMADADVDFKDYDWNGDGEVEQVFVVYAGYGEASDEIGTLGNTIWPHEFQLQYAAYYPSIPDYPDFSTFSNLKLDGVRINTYACSNELTSYHGSQMDGVGTACHEFSHCLGLPDMYDTSGSAFGMGAWDLMDAGCYGGPSKKYFGCVPVAYTAYERWFAGWIEPTELKEGCNIVGMRPITETAEAYVLYNGNKKTEYYLLENRQPVSWDKCINGHGLLVTHIDYNKQAWDNNEVNNDADHQRCTIIAADNSWEVYNADGTLFNAKELAGDPYPGTSQNHALTDTSKPAASLFNKNSDGRYYMGKPIEDIQESEDGLISFIFDGGQLITIEPPIANEAISTEVGDGSFIATWSEVENAESYTIELKEARLEPLNVLVNENFDKVNAATNTSRDISGTLDEYLSTSGWTGKKLYSGAGEGLKMGTSSSAGQLISPLLTSATGTATLLFTLAQYGNDRLNMKVTVSDAEGTVVNEETYTTAGTHLLNVADLSGDFTISFETMRSGSYRAYLGMIKVVDGEASEEEMNELDEETKGRGPLLSSRTQLITDITETQYTFTGLTAEAYTYRVKAVTPEGESPWSNVVMVHLEDFVTGISLPATPLQPSDVTEVYSTNGTWLRRSSTTHWQDGLPRGIYILKSGNSIHKAVR